MMLSRLKNWCIKAILRPGFVFGGGTCPVICPSPSLATLGGLRKSRLCASKVIGLVGCILTSAVEDWYGTTIVLDPSFPRKPEFRRKRRWRCAFFFDRCLSHDRPACAPERIVIMKAIVATSRVAFEVCLTFERKRRAHGPSIANKGSPECRRVDWAAIILLIPAPESVLWPSSGAK